jgi:carbonic anhydrase/acetyltransferase-like protein (isoleucine patch superfamily)
VAQDQDLGVLGTVGPGELGQDRPDVSGTAFVAPGAMLIGRVRIGAEASVWYGAVLRADREAIVVGERSNVQDGCVLRADPGVPLSVGSEVTIGHNATLHGAPWRIWS